MSVIDLPYDGPLAQCRYCTNVRSKEPGECSHCGSPILPDDYEACGECGMDHDYEYQEAHKWHMINGCVDISKICDTCNDTGKYRLIGIDKEQSCEVCRPFSTSTSTFDFNAYNGIKVVS